MQFGEDEFLEFIRIILMRGSQLKVLKRYVT